MREEVNILESATIAADWWCDKIKNQTFDSNNVFGLDVSFVKKLFDVDDNNTMNNIDNLDNFKKILELVVSSELKKHHYCELMTDYKPFGLLEDIEKLSQVKNTVFPLKTKMRVFEDRVSISNEFCREYEEIYSTKQKQKVR